MIMLFNLALFSEKYVCFKPIFKSIVCIFFFKKVIELRSQTNKAINDLHIFKTKSEKRRVFADIVCCYFAYDSKPYEYFLLKFNTLSPQQRNEFITDIYKDKICIKISNINDFYTKIKDKYGAYLHFKDFYKRDIIIISSPNDYLKFQDFISKHTSFVIKQMNGARGIGIKFIDIKNISNNTKEFFNDLISENVDYVIEELIDQANEMSQWHPHSINTVRLPGVLNDERYSVFTPIVRIGINGSFVDNASQGGIFANIDIKTGVIYTDGYDELGNIYTTHPNTKVSFKGFVIPNWDELIQLANRAAMLLPSNPYIAWDFALSNKGWVIVEANWGQLLMFQIAEQKGKKKEFLKLVESYL